jgi:predicted Zn-dependent protease with MMP-like domain
LEREEFEKVVEEVIESLPEIFREKLENLVIIVEDWPSNSDLKSLGLRSRDSLFGLYKGVPLTKRGALFGNFPPDCIVIFKKPLEKAFRDINDMKREIAKTVMHEIAHHFGFDEEMLRKLGY